jgi:hypothetical protein
MTGSLGVSGEVGDDEEQLRVRLSDSIFNAFEAGGPTGTMRDPNSTPIVTSWEDENRPSQSRIVNYSEGQLD